MSTTLVRKEDVQRKWYVLDAADKPLGRTAVIAANLLRGKLKPDFTPNVDCGDYVIIVNVEKAVLTGRKLEEKYYRRHSGWIGGLKETRPSWPSVPSSPWSWPSRACSRRTPSAELPLLV